MSVKNSVFLKKNFFEYMCMYANINMHIYQFSPQRKLSNNGTPIGTSSQSVHILFSKAFTVQGTRILGHVAESRAEANDI